ncbi:MAG: glycosyltransferase family 2 protein [Rhodospirillales bacterium]|nr:glycosyltransferase family 2 protein [Rhodospirillales bacterium]
MSDYFQTSSQPIIAAVVPCYREGERVLPVLESFGTEVALIIVVDDACPIGTGELVKSRTNDPRISVITHDQNQGVGGASLTGFAKAIELGADIIVKVDGDGQMDPAMIPRLVKPILEGRADYTKGNRFFRLQGVIGMPILRLIGNLALSFASKLSSGYWKLFDPTNGFVAIHARVAQLLPLGHIDHRYFFESDMLFHLNINRAVVIDVPIDAIYGDEKSGLRISRILLPFAWKHSRNLFRRLFYNYLLRDFTFASIELVLGSMLTGFGIIFGSMHWYTSYSTGIAAATGVVVLAALTFILGAVLLLGFLNYDVQNQPQDPLYPDL